MVGNIVESSRKQDKAVTPQSMRTLVEDLYELCATDMDKALELYIHDDFVIEEATDLPMAGTYRGKSGLKALYSRVFQMVEAEAIEREFFMAGDQCCACRVTLRLTDPSLKPIELMEFFRFQDGRVVEIRPYYFSPEQFRRAAGVLG